MTQSVVEIDKIVISDSNSGTAAANTNLNQTLSTQNEKGRFSQVSDVVSKSVGIHVQRLGGLEESTSVSIRGSSNSQVQVYLDEVPLDTASGGGIGLSQMSAASLDKVEVYKNLVPIGLGGAAVGGVFNLKSAAIKSGNHERFGLGFGSYTTYDVLAEFSHGGEDSDVVFGFD